MGDGESSAKAGQQPLNGYYNLEKMLKALALNKGSILLCGTCMDARALKVEELAECARRSTFDELTEHTLSADKVLVF